MTRCNDACNAEYWGTATNYDMGWQSVVIPCHNSITVKEVKEWNKIKKNIFILFHRDLKSNLLTGASFSLYRLVHYRIYARWEKEKYRKSYIFPTRLQKWIIILDVRPESNLLFVMRKKDARLTIRLDQENMNKIEECAALERTTRSEVIRLALMSYASNK